MLAAITAASMRKSSKFCVGCQKGRDAVQRGILSLFPREILYEPHTSTHRRCISSWPAYSPLSGLAGWPTGIPIGTPPLGAPPTALCMARLSCSLP